MQFFNGECDKFMCMNVIVPQVGLKYNESVVIRVTGCPNGCARPYMAELGMVGDGPNSYQVFKRGILARTHYLLLDVSPFLYLAI